LYVVQGISKGESGVSESRPVGISKWLWLSLALACGIAAAFAFLVYMANGMAAGDLIGIRGREHAVAITQHRSLVGLLSGIFLQFGVAGALFAFLDREDDHAGPLFWAVFASIAVTLACGWAVDLAQRAFH
jgi:hypothetical protein